MIKKILNFYLRKKNGGYIGGLKSVFENVSIMNSVVKQHTNKKLAIIEVGSERGVGSTYFLSKYCVKNELQFVTIDPSEESNRSAQNILKKFKSNDLSAVMAKGEDYLKNYNGNPILLAYLDGFDVIFPNAAVDESRISFYADAGIDFVKDGNRISGEVHMEAVNHIYQHVVEGGLIAFDDTYLENNEWFGKGSLAVPFLLKNGFKSINSTGRERNHSILLQKTN